MVSILKRSLAIITLLIVGYWLAQGLAGVPFGEDKMLVGHYYLQHVKEQTGAVNAVTAIVVNYRGFDTLGEVTVLFIASTGVAALLWRKKRERTAKVEGSVVLTTGAGASLPVHSHVRCLHIHPRTPHPWWRFPRWSDDSHGILAAVHGVHDLRDSPQGL